MLKYAKQEQVECFGTLKLIEILIEKKIITTSEAIAALTVLKSDSSRRIPHNLINDLINNLKK